MNETPNSNAVAGDPSALGFEWNVRSQLQSQLQVLLEAAEQVSQHAYCPYSRFAVGAAVLSESGRIYVGCNIENAAYSPGVCAERTAVGNMVSAGEQRLVAVAVFTATKRPTAPCGVCRQVLFEFSRDAKVVCGCAEDLCLNTSVAALLPAAFGPHSLL
jgi:cytidine deaminase